MQKKFILLALAIVFSLSACGDKAPPRIPASDTSSPVGYQATLADGIDLTKEGYPIFIAAVSGMSGYEPWGRWTDADAGGAVARFTFKDKLPQSFTLAVTANAYGPNEGQPIEVKAGSIVKRFTIKNGETPSVYIIRFNEVDGNTLDFTPPSPTSPKSLGIGEDPRKVGIGFISIKIFD
jgi:phosphoglycerol transferase